jgi:hypothetical protein
VPRELETIVLKRLVTLTNGTVRGIHVWDLRSIRRELAAIGLDWK